MIYNIKIIIIIDIDNNINNRCLGGSVYIEVSYIFLRIINKLLFKNNNNLILRYSDMSS